MQRRRSTPYALMAPSLLIIAAITFYPIYYAVDISLFQTRFLQKGAFVGLANYARLLDDAQFLRSLAVSLKFAILSLLLTMPLGMAFALLLRQPIRFRSAFRTILIVPWTLSQSVTGMLWLWILNPSYGPVKYVLDEFGFPPVLFLSSPDWALVVLCLVNAWMTYPLPTVLLLAALQTVPRELTEAASIDGCTPFGAFWRVTLPFISATVMTTAIMVTLQFLNTVTLIYVMTGGGPLGSTQTLSMRVFVDGFFNFRVAGAAAVGMVIFALNVVFGLSYIRVLRTAEAV